ncbi:hypothetical protein DAPPUDRAFT_330803 [Daphnia pulex]|uniref:Replication factor-A protein 1 N-terminal domain-containing protein n=1 Tax=Daphnia pulex TaxID=6669 RepID=E9HKP4_DAPPU|nr:hypothetical protein DAPPUDRAFT_330803 [Daphnia pulex]|eukprot:EFX67702.1 hypothetical protein DAPPUDRAFT_330803 [Daphnia pulex]
MNERDIQALNSWRDSLSTGAIPCIIRNCLKETPVFLQVLDYTAVKGDKHDRYRLVISHGKYSYTYGMLATKLNHLVEDGQFEIFTIIKVKKFVITFPTVVASKADGKKGYEIILWDIVPLVPSSEVGEMLGNPQTVNDDGEVADVPSITNNFVPFDQLPNLEDDV